MPASVTFICPTYPSFRGNGLAMRAAATLQLLSTWCGNVHLLIIPLYESQVKELSPEIASFSKSVRIINNPDPAATPVCLPEWVEALQGLSVVPREWAACNAQWKAAVRRAIEDIGSDLVFLFRFYLAPFVSESQAPIWLDIDELESTSRARLAHVYGLSGKQREALQARMEAAAFEKLECRYLDSFERIFAASGLECDSVLNRNPGASVRIMPNTYPRILPQVTRPIDGSARILFVGTLGYYPNIDALAYFCRDMLSRIQEHSQLPVELTVIGSGNIAASERPEHPGVRLVGTVPDTTPHYRDCDLVIVPLRSAGGTRIKILEAFSHKRAVVSTRMGAEGLDLTPGVHALIADSPEDFACACLRLINNASEREEIAENGHAFFLKHHTLPSLEENSPLLFAQRSMAK